MTTLVVPVASNTATSQKTRRDLAIEAIMAETDVGKGLAHDTLDWVQGFVNRSRKHGYVVQFPSEKQMMSRCYGVFDKIASHGKSARPGSAHAAIEAAVLDPAKGEYGLLHDGTRPDGTVRRNCEVRVLVNALT